MMMVEEAISKLESMTFRARLKNLAESLYLKRKDKKGSGVIMIFKTSRNFCLGKRVIC